MATAGHGRPAKQKAAIEALKKGNTRTAAAAAAGVDKTTFYDWLHNDPTFSHRVAGAEADAEIEWQGDIAKAGKNDWRALAWLMERRFGRDWRERKDVNIRDLTIPQLIELAGSGEGGIESPGDRAANSGQESPSLSE